MTVDIFTKEEFEEALPVHNETGDKLWYGLGLNGTLQSKEYTYRVPIVKGEIEIEIQSSVTRSGFSDGVGENSIRAWLIGSDSKPLGSKVSRWVTRQPGWQERLLETLRTLWNWVEQSGYCPTCKNPRMVFKVKNGGNKGRIFCKCIECDKHFEWIT